METSQNQQLQNPEFSPKFSRVMSASSFTKVNENCGIQISKNSNIPKLNEPRTCVQYTRNCPFDFDSINNPKKSLILSQSLFRLNQLNELSNTNDEIIRGKFCDKKKYKTIEARRKIQGKIGLLKLPAHFFFNSEDYIPKMNSKLCVNYIEDLNNDVNGNEIKMINFSYVKIPQNIQNDVFLKFQKFQYIEIITLRGSGITELPNVTLPYLRVVDVCENNIAEGDTAISFAKRHFMLSIFDYRRNPIAEVESIRIAIIESNYNLKHINGRQISVRDRVQAIEKSKDSLMKNNIGKYR